ncbi:ATP-dependent DNA helicase UvrD2 [Aquihabitans sp. G128]|uniref:ATP-dependent helicase n=1 Tax=Aquihabitans sp. G128 TaxID=2849779 RepID=UPI001C219F80|nr:ATP-dependent DNA helicase UvrD2 [Aquihabitans sp. G128]QXC62522.1 ATP-dependent DNA helicase UvrD2 [Aquihabitans sp. G128]
MDPERLLDGLDPAQRRAVTATTHPLAILAGAGSGKTRVLTRRIAHRCLTGDADARHVLAVTFTRKAAAELDTRLRTFGLRDLPAAGTFHALAYAQLRTAWAGAGTTPPVLLDRKGRLLARILGNTTRVRPGELATEIEWARARLVAPDGYVDAVHRAGRLTAVDPERIADWYRRYEIDKRKRGIIDFDDLLARAADQIERDPSFAAAQRWRFRHLFVDEYQDVNPLQDRLLRAWLGDRRDLCVVGDANQAIYGWNGADAGFLLDFERHHPGAEVVELRDSYRSTPQVLAVAAAVLAAGRGPARPLVAHRGDGPLPVVVGYQSDGDEANGIARAVREHHGPGRPWSAQAVLVRTNAQGTVIEAAFRRAAIPYRVRGAHQFLDDPDVRDLLKRFGRLSEPLSTTLADLDASVARQRAELLGSAWDDDLDDDAPPPLARELPDTAAGRRLGAFEQVVRLGNELLVLEPAARTDALPGWLRTVLLDDGPGAADAVTIASFHAAKGLEWDVVHLAGVEAGYVPISHARSPEAKREEERLFYVAVTRASDVLRCSWAKTRTFGSDPVDRAPSPFLGWVRGTVTDLGRAEAAAPVPERAIDRSRAALAEPPEVEPDPAVLTAAVAASLRAWRAEQGRRAGVRPTVVLSDRALDAVARNRPRSSAALAEQPGLGPLARERHGARLLAIVAEHLGDDAGPPASTSVPAGR